MNKTTTFLEELIDFMKDCSWCIQSIEKNPDLESYEQESTNYSTFQKAYTDQLENHGYKSGDILIPLGDNKYLHLTYEIE